MTRQTIDSRNVTDSVYIHGSDPEEQRRLSTLNAFMNGPSLREINVQPGERILDVGSGLAQLTRAMARTSGPNGYVLGIERDARQLAEAHRLAKEAGEDSIIELREGNAYDPPLRDSEWGTFDLAHARFVLEHVPDPLRVVRMMLRAVKPGGRIVLEDDDHEVLRFHPEPPHFRVFWDAYVETYEHVGNDPYVGRKLISLMHNAGALPTRNTWIFFGTCKNLSEPLFRAAPVRKRDEPRNSVRADCLPPYQGAECDQGGSTKKGGKNGDRKDSLCIQPFRAATMRERNEPRGFSPRDLSEPGAQATDTSTPSCLDASLPSCLPYSIDNRQSSIDNPIDTFAAAVSNLEGIIRFSRRDIVDPGLLDAATFDAFEREFHEWSQLPDAALWYAICFAEGRKSPTDALSEPRP
ncbi:MAG: methyltransferase domain-containing protein [Planctomycetes bacterium]|nr:methyltransferase domain-containing protein [Planctomycetota bacterium]MBI3834620.1 methyltransferase domain-containing protein [Planctomycetota bacterium]